MGPLIEIVALYLTPSSPPCVLWPSMVVMVMTSPAAMSPVQKKASHLSPQPPPSLKLPWPAGMVVRTSTFEMLMRSNIM